MSAVALLGVTACGASDEQSPPGPGAPTEPEAVEVRNGLVPCDALETGFVGDELCIRPPDPGTGLHLHVGPTDYDDPDQIAYFSIGPGEEPTAYYQFTTPNEEPISFYRQHYRMRPGSHHLIVHVRDQPVIDEGWSLVRPSGYELGGTQRSVSDFPPNDLIPEEDANLARPVGAHVPMAFELHYVNSTDEPILREAWVNFMQSDAEAPELLGGLFMIGAQFNVPPGAAQTINYTSGPAFADTRVHSLFGHRHANTTRLSAWAHVAGERILMYEDYDWSEPAEFVFNSVTDNGVPDPATRTPGGFSGILNLAEGDRIEWECEVENHHDVALIFGNEVYTKEMCNLFGATVSSGAPIWFEFLPEFVQR